MIVKIKNSLRKILFSKWNDQQIDNFYKVYYRVRYPDEMMKRKTFGKLNPDKTFYVIRPRKDCTEGLLSLFWNVIRNIDFAIQNGYEPIVDFVNNKTQYSQNGNNIWEEYFTQPSEFDLNEVYKSKYVILSGVEIGSYKKELFTAHYDRKSLRTLNRFIFSKIDFSSIVKERVQIEMETLNIDRKHTLGLYLRGTDYLNLKPPGHPVQPNVEQAIAVVEQYLDKYPIEKIFLVTEDGIIHDRIIKKYGEKCITATFDTYIYNYSGKRYISRDKSIEELQTLPVERGMNYLVKMIILSKCGYMIGGNTNGSWASCVFSNDEFIDKYIFDLGMYGK